MSQTINKYVLENDNLKVVISNLGGAILNFVVKGEKDIDIVLGHQNLEDYVSNPGNHGVIVGRNANRIEDASVIINDISYDLEVNHFHNNLHTGSGGLQYHYFDVEEGDNTLILTTSVKHLEDGFPGNLSVKVEYKLEDNALSITYNAVSDQDTIVNLTNHSYFNLNGQDHSTIYNHNLLINSEYYMPNNEFSLPDKRILKSSKSAFDFKEGQTLKKSLSADEEQVTMFNGLDHNFLINNSDDERIAHLSNDSLDFKVYTDQHAMHVYTGNHFSNEDPLSKNNGHYPKHGGIAFETQISPNSMNMPWMKSPLLKANEVYKTYTKFEVIKKD